MKPPVLGKSGMGWRTSRQHQSAQYETAVYPNLAVYIQPQYKFPEHTDEGEQRRATEVIKGLRQLPAEERLSSWDSSGGQERLKGDMTKVYVPCAVDMVKVEALHARTQELGAHIVTNRKSV